MFSIVSFEVRTNYRLQSRLSVPRDRDWSNNNEDDGDDDDDDDEPKNFGKVRSTDVDAVASCYRVALPP